MEFSLAIISCLFVLAGAQTSGDVRLADGPNAYSGRPEVFRRDEWSTIGYNFSTAHDVAATVCVQLGHVGVEKYNTVSDLNFPPADSGTNMFVNTSCGFDTPHILRCSYTPVISVSDHSSDMGLICDTSSYKPYNGAVRLVEGNTGFNSSGFVEVYLHNEWGTVCGMRNYDADSACRQLGYTEASNYGSATTAFKYDPKLDNFYCRRSQVCLKSCFFYPSYNDSIICSGAVYSYVNCSFTEELSPPSYGTSLSCSYTIGYIVELAVGLFFAFVITIALCIIIPVVICCCVPGCILFGTRKRTVYQNI